MGTVPDSTILLNIYDVVEHPFNYRVAKWMSLGIHHSGIQIGMREFAFTVEGIVVTEPHQIPRCKLTQKILLKQNATEALVLAILSRLQRKFKPQTYDPLYLNCNAFSDAFCRCVGSRLPSWVNRAPTIARTLGASFRLRPPRITAPALEWSRMLVEDDANPSKPFREIEIIQDEDPRSELQTTRPVEDSVKSRRKNKSKINVSPKPRPSPSPNRIVTRVPTPWLDALSDGTYQQEQKEKGSVKLPAGIDGVVNTDLLLASSTVVVDIDATLKMR